MKAINLLFLALLIVGAAAFGALAQNNRPEARGRRSGSPPRTAAQKYSIAQAVSDSAQLPIVAFRGLAFITGDFGASAFMPPGKVCDSFGFP